MKSASIFSLLAVVLFSVSMITFYADSTADARARGGGRSFGSSRTFRSTRPATAPPISQRSSRSGSGSFMRGIGGGLLGGFLGSLLFGSLVHAGGGIGGSGIGLFQILIIGGIGYFLYKKFLAKPGNRPGSSGQQQGQFSGRDYSPSPPDNSGPVIDAPPPGGGPANAGTTSSSVQINQDEIKEIAQDIFFKVQAAWMRRDIDAVRDILGPELLSQYQAEFQDMKAKGVINRLENIAVRRVEVVDYGRESGFEYVKVRFTANLLDYTVEEATGRVIQGNDHEPVKFEEIWTLARQEGSNQWKLYAIEDV
ncbi:MAG: Tim44 domain-containing protein [Thermodesulfatator sp.]|nr:MAG: Tim44 domain-containing protein [Thermodesulfatator sp.]